ncbi:MAG: ParB/RepB/Spo0J family partition protein [candidate division WOR-3 bacterium]|nr:MAG: ParB/RepB/Spo0J family partition protein [candidate division WOR-3 bacterium]
MRKRALGKGLEALIPTKEKEVFQEGYRLIPISSIKPNPYQPRSKIEASELKDLITSIKEKGVIEPIVVKRVDNQFILAAGERRFRAAELAGLKDIPAIIRDLTEAELLEIGLIENLQRKDLNPIEEARAYEQLHKTFGLTHEQIAQLVGKDRSTITNSLRLLSLPDKVKTYLRTGKLNQGHARALLALEDNIKMLQICERIVKEDLSVRATENLIKRLRKRPRIVPGAEKEPNLRILENELSKLLRTKVTITWKKNRGTILIQCFSLDDFDRIYEILKKIRQG